MANLSLIDRIEQVLGRRPEKLQPLHGGMIAEVYRVDFPDGERLVIKRAEGPNPQLDIEGYMLDYLGKNSRLPVPEVIHSEPSLLVMTYIEGQSQINNSVQLHAAELLADLHSNTAPQFGLERDTLIGPLKQPNPWTDSWIDFFRDQRLFFMAQEAHRNGPLPLETLQRIEQLCARLDDYLTEPTQPALIHGDIWTTNVLASNGRITGLVDPATYYAHPEIELAYTALFGTFGIAFYRRYQEIGTLEPGFFEVRRDIYNLYPLLVHVRLFGGSYVYSVQQVLNDLKI